MSSATVSRKGTIVETWLPEIALLAMLVGLSILLTYEMAHLWARPHFQFAPLAWSAFVAFAIFQYRQIATVESFWRGALGKTLCLAGLVLALLSAQIFSPWLAHVAAGLCIAGWGLLRLPELNMWRWLGWTLLIWSTVPLPGTLDGAVINTLQRISAQSASSLLDLCGVLHLRQGNLIEIRNGKLFVDEACSGIDSLYALLAVTLFLALWQRLPMVVGVMSLACVPVFAWLGNVLRLFAITWFLDVYQVDLSKGTPHTLLGFATFGLAGAGLYLTAIAFARLLHRLPSAAVARSQAFWHQFYNTVVCFPDAPPEVQEDTSEYYEQQRNTAVESLSSRGPSGSIRFRKFEFGGLFVVAVACLGLSIFKLTRANAEYTALTLPHFQAAEIDAAFSRENFPSTIGQANLVDYTKLHRPADAFFGEHSRTWQYHHPVCDFQMSVDFPFLGFHPLWICYTTTGNTLVNEPAVIAIPGSEDAHVTEMKMTDELGNVAYVWFTFVNQIGETIEPSPFKPDLRSTFTGRLLNAFRSNVMQPQIVTYQYQLFLPSGRELTAAERKEVLEIFGQCLPSVQNQVKRLTLSK